MEKEKIYYEKSNKYPEDYHTSELEEYYKGEIIQENGKPYNSRTIRRKYYSPKEREIKHLCPGHLIGYRFVIENFTKEGDKIFDPCVGSGTTIVESITNNRLGYGIELEYSEIAKENINYQGVLSEYGKLWEGDARDIKKIIPPTEKFDLIITGTPYNNNSDSPERKDLKTKENYTFNYENKDNIAFLSDENYYKTIHQLYKDCCDYLKDGGYFSIIIKDTIRKKKAYLLHKYISDEILKISGMKIESIFIHKHYPPTLFMSTYNKRFPDVKIPKYQTIVIFKKELI